MKTLDWIVLLLFIGGLFGIVFWVLKHKKDDTSDYFLSGRSEGWLTVGAAIFAANIGSEHLVGLAGAGAESGMAMAHYEMQGWMILILGWLFVPFYQHSKVFTMPEFLSRRYNKNTSSILSIITLISYVLTKVSVTAYTGGIFLKTVFGIESIGNIDFFWIAAIGLVLFTGIFTVLGGMKGIMLVSVIQTPILLIGAVLVFTIGLIKVGGWHEVMSYLQENGTVHLMRPHSDPKFPWTGMVLGSAIAGFWYWCTDQHIVQRVLSARNLTQARRGTIFAGFLKLFPVFMFLIPGVMATVLKQKGVLDFGNNDMAYGSMVAALLPMGIRGILIVGFIAALMTSLAAHFNSSATLFTIDFYKKYKPGASEQRLVLIGRMATVVVVMLGLIWIPIMRGLGSVLYEYLQNIQSLIAPGIAAVFILGVFNTRITPKAGEWGLIVGFLIGMFRLTLMIFSKNIQIDSVFGKLLSINWLHFSIFLIFFIMALMAVMSIFTQRSTMEQLRGITYFSQTPEQIAETRKSWNKWDAILSAGVVVLVVIFYYYFW